MVEVKAVAACIRFLFSANACHHGELQNAGVAVSGHSELPLKEKRNQS